MTMCSLERALVTDVNNAERKVFSVAELWYADRGPGSEIVTTGSRGCLCKSVASSWDRRVLPEHGKPLIVTRAMERGQ